MLVVIVRCSPKFNQVESTIGGTYEPSMNIIRLFWIIVVIVVIVGYLGDSGDSVIYSKI